MKQTFSRIGFSLTAPVRTIDDLLSKGKGSLDSYFLADRGLMPPKVSNLLISSSFGANSILYSMWLGYVMGFWAMLIHLAWCMSFVLLSFFAPKISKYTSLHDFLLCRFGKVSCKIASVFSIVGVVYFAGWEIAIAKSGLDSFLISAGINSSLGAPIIFGIIIILALLYSSIGGQKANGYADTVFNYFKYLLLFVVAFILLKSAMSSISDANIQLPSFSRAIGEIGVFGFITNIVLNISWQFVDNTSWQSISSCETSNPKSTKYAMIKAGAGVFVSYLLGTTLGVLLRPIPNLNSDNIIGGLTQLNGMSSGVMLCIVIILLVSMISLINGVGLSVSQTLLVDLRIPISKLRKKSNVLQVARITTIVAGIFAAWGVQFILGLLGTNVFSFVYIFIIAQLSLLGVVLVGLLTKRKSLYGIWISIILGAIAGICATIVGNIFNIAWLSEAAGTFTTFVATVSSLIYMSSKSVTIVDIC
jgi:Na+/proline symporter